MPEQLPLFPEQTFHINFPTTRYQGSKRKLLGWIWQNVKDLEFDCVLDVFGGTGVVSHLFKSQNKQVTYNDSLAFNWNIGLALIENADVRLTDTDIEAILTINDHTAYPDFIEQTFRGIYYTDNENRWLDRVLHNINHRLDDPFKQALGRFALFQACIVKRPYNLFHRANLYIRQAEVRRSFGNKTTWDTPFETHFRKFAEEANAAVFDNRRDNRALNLDAAETPVGADLVYLDPPYISLQGVGVDYRDFYHFLEGMMRYEKWPSLVDYDSKHRRLNPQRSEWVQASSITTAFEQLIARHKDSMIVISYRDDGIPDRNTLVELLSGYKSDVRQAALPQQYVLSTRSSHELLLIGV